VKDLQELKRLRENTVHVAQPIRVGPVFQPAPSAKPLTEPESPMLKEKRERVMRQMDGLRVVASYESDESDGDL
jgi:hypothetical protein